MGHDTPQPGAGGPGERTAERATVIGGPPASSGTRFDAGHVLAERYRIVGSLGKGGMGEVYRADDLTLGTSVALKFLPPEFTADPVRLERFRGEVRVARQISHPNVCRVFDIVEADGHHFLAMEYIDGEDLGVLIKRIGRVPGEKAIEIARQVCGGLAALRLPGRAPAVQPGQEPLG